MKRPDLQRYHTMAGHEYPHHDSEEGETTTFGHHGDPITLTSDPDEHVRPSQGDNKTVSEKVSERSGCTDGGMDNDRGDEDGLRGDSSGNSQNCRKDSLNAINLQQAKREGGKGKNCAANDRDHQEPAGGPKPTRKARKPDREFYQPGGRRGVQGKESGGGGEQDKPSPTKEEPKMEPESQREAGEREGDKNRSTSKERGKEKEGEDKVNGGRGGETNRRQGRRDGEKASSVSETAAEGLASKIEKLCVKEEGKKGAAGQESEEVGGGRRKASGEGRRGQAGGGGANDKGEKTEKKRERGNRSSRRRGGEKEREGTQESRRGRAEGGGGGGGGKSDEGTVEKERDRRASEGDREKGRTGEAHQGKGREKPRERESQRGNNNNNRPRDPQKDAEMVDRNRERAVGGSQRNKPNANATTPSSKRYSKSDIRRTRNRTYSSSSASSVTSLDGPGLRRDEEKSQWKCLVSGSTEKAEGRTDGGGGSRRGSQLQNRKTNRESSTDSLDGSEMSDAVDGRRRDEKDRCAERQREENNNRHRGHKAGGGGILRVSIEKQSVASHASSGHGEDPQHRRQGSGPRGRGRGILVLPAHTDLSNSPEPGPRLLFGGIRGGATGRGRGGRGGGTRRLWDPNNPDQKPALNRAQPSQQSPLQQPMYLQTVAGYGQLHFLDTDDEVAGSPPIRQGEHFPTQAAAMAYYKFQNSDNPYGYAMATNNPNNPNATTNQRYPYPYHMGPYQMAPSNGMYPGPGIGPFCGGYRGMGYPQPGAGGALTPGEVEQQARGELGRLLRAADAQELQLSNLLSRDRLSAEGLDRMAQLR